MLSKSLLLIALAGANLSLAQTASFSGPVEAFAFDLPTRSVRPVLGFPGSSSFGPAIVESLEFGSVAPAQNYAIVLHGLEWQLALHLDLTRPSYQALTGITGRPDGIAWSQDGSLAILYSLAGNWIQTLSGLPSQPAAGPQTSVSPLGGALTAVASDATGKQIAVAVNQGTGAAPNAGQSAGVFLFQAATQTFVPLLALGNPVALAFSSDNASVLAVDSSARQLSVINVASRSSQNVSLAGLADPFAVSSTPVTSGSQTTSQMIYVASRSDQILREFDLASQQVIADLPLNFVPTGLNEFGRKSFLVASRARAADPLWLFVNAPPAIFFVPALAELPLRTERGDGVR
jgi:hypothetical protein